MKFDSVDYNFSKFSGTVLSTIKLTFHSTPEVSRKFEERLEKLKEDFKITSELHFKIFLYDSCYILKISINHSSEEIPENAKNAIQDILSLDSIFFLLHHGSRNYYSFLCEMFLKDL
jgi:hypothetical protein